MPTYEITSPDGRKFRVNAPDGATQADALAYVQGQNSQTKAAPPSDADSVGPLDAAAIAAGEWVDKKAAGLREAMPESVRNAIDKFGSALGMAPPPNADRAASDKAMAPLREASPVATFIGGTAPDLAVVNPLSMGALAALDPGTLAERAGRGALAFGLGKAGQAVGEKVAGALAGRADDLAANRAVQAANAAPRDATIREAQAAGYTIPPTQVNPQAPGIMNRMLEGFSGKIQTGQAAAIKNEAVTSKLVRDEFNLPPDTPLTTKTFQAIRKTAGTAYDQLKQFGPVATDDAFKGALDNISGEYRGLVQDFPTQRNGAIDDLLKDLDKPQFNSSSAVELVKRLRKDGYSNLKAFDNPERQALGKVQLGAQNAIEDLLERNLEQSGNAGFLDVFRRARVMIAKAHTVENALEESTGKVVASKIKNDYAKGVPLTGGLATIGKTAEAFPKALQNVNTSMPGLSPLDYMGGLLGGAVGHPGAALGVFARPVVRAGILSGPYQRVMAGAPSHQPKLQELLANLVGDNPQLSKDLGGLLGVGGLRAYQSGN